MNFVRKYNASGGLPTPTATCTGPRGGCNIRWSKRSRATRDMTAVTRDRTGLISAQSSV